MISGKTICSRLDELDPRWSTTLNNLDDDHPAHVSPQASGQWRKERCPHTKTLGAIADYYHVPVGYLIGEIDRLGNKKERFSDVLSYLDDLRRTPGYDVNFSEDHDDAHGRRIAVSMHISVLSSEIEIADSDVDLIFQYLNQVEAMRNAPVDKDIKELAIKHIRESILNKSRTTESEN